MQADQEEKMAIAELRRLDRGYSRIKKEIQAFYAGAKKIRPFRYVLNYSFDVAGLATGEADVTLFPSQEKNFITRENTLFFCKELTFHFEVQGTLQGGANQNVRVPPGANGWKDYIDFDWRVRDTDSNREWQNRELPAQLLMSNSVNALKFGNGHSRMEGGTEVVFTVIPTRINIPTGAAFTFSAMNSYEVEITFGGEEVIR